MYQALESDVQKPNAQLWVTFYPGKLPNEFRSSQTGKPEFDLVDFIRIAVPGDTTNVVERPKRDSDEYEWPGQWNAYKRATTYRPESGTPVEDWPRLDVATVAKLKALEFHTVEQIAGASDAQIQKIGMGCYELRLKATAYVEQAKDSALAQKQAEQLAQRDVEINDLKAANAGLAQRLTQLEAMLSQPQTEEPRRRVGRPSNAELAARAAE